MKIFETILKVLVGIVVVTIALTTVIAAVTRSDFLIAASLLTGLGTTLVVIATSVWTPAMLGPLRRWVPLEAEEARLLVLPEALPGLRVALGLGPLTGEGHVADGGVEPDVQHLALRIGVVERDGDAPVEIAGHRSLG